MYKHNVYKSKSYWSLCPGCGPGSTSKQALRNEGRTNDVALFGRLPLGGDFDLLSPKIDATLPSDVRRVAKLWSQNATKAKRLTRHRHTNVHTNHARSQLFLAGITFGKCQDPWSLVQHNLSWMIYQSFCYSKSHKLWHVWLRSK